MDPKNLLIVALSLSALALALILGFGGRGSDGMTITWLQTGTDLSGVSAVDREGREVSLATGEPTLLMVFRSDCAHSEAVAPLWKAWAESPGSDLQALALSSEPIQSAADYVQDHGWDVRVLEVNTDAQGGLVEALTRRTPWVFLVGGDGVILSEGHGSKIEEIARGSMKRPLGGSRP